MLTAIFPQNYWNGIHLIPCLLCSELKIFYGTCIVCNGTVKYDLRKLLYRKTRLLMVSGIFSFCNKSVFFRNRVDRTV